jgi:S1-C subfamily serine protease
VDSVQKNGVIKRAFMGIKTTALTPDIVKNLGLAFTFGDVILDTPDAITSNSPAMKAGLENGDIITEAAGTPISADMTLRDILKDKTPGEEITLKVWRKKSEKIEVVRLILGEK